MTTQRQRGLSGFVPIRNGIELDYAFVESILSLVPVCDEVVACDADSTDGTSAVLRALSLANPKIRVVNWPWPNPHGDVLFLLKWLEFARQQLRFDMMLELDADEVLDDSLACHQSVRDTVAAGSATWLRRLNYWLDTRHLAPEGRACATWVARLGPSHLEMPSDEPRHPEPEIRQIAQRRSECVIHHLGFLRHKEQFIAKSKVVQNAFFASVDPRLLEQEATGKPWTDRDYFDGLPLQEIDQPLPAVALPWLRERGHVV